MGITAEKVNRYLSRRLLTYANKKRENPSLEPLFISQSELFRKLGAEQDTDKETIIQCASSFIDSYNTRMEKEGAKELVIDTDISEEEMERARTFREYIQGVESEGEVHISLSESGFLINQHDFSPPYELLEFAEVLGEPSREYGNGRKVYVYDDWGINIVEKTDIAEVVQLNIFFSYCRDTEMEWAPDNVYIGVFELNNVDITKSQTVSQVKGLLPHLSFRRLRGLTPSYQTELGKFTILFVHKYKPLGFLRRKIDYVFIRLKEASRKEH